MSGGLREDVDRGMQLLRDRMARMEQRVADKVAAELAGPIAALAAQLDTRADRIERKLEEAAANVEGAAGARLAELHDRLHADLLAEMAELARMLRMQGDADDQLADTLGRTLLRLSAEVESLDASVAHLEATAATRRAGRTARADPS